MIQLRRHLLSLLVAASAAILPTLGMAQAWPTKTVTLIVPYAPGGATDVIARVVAQRLSLRIGKEVIVENKAGAGGVIGLSAVANAAPDGHTLLVIDSSFAGIAALTPERRNGVTAVGLLATAPYVISVGANVQARTLQELIGQARIRPGAVNYSSGGLASSTHFAGEWFKILSGTSLTHIPYRGGSLALQAVMAGEAEVTFLTMPTVQQQVKAGKLRALAVTGEQRSPMLPDVPTTKEAGLAKMTGLNWNALFAPAKTPLPLVARLNKEVNAVLQMPEVRAKLAELSLEAAPESVEHSQAVIEDEIQRWGGVAKAANIKPE